MKLVGKRRLSGVLEIVMWVLMAGVIVALVMLPYLLDWMMQFNNDPDFWRPLYVVTLGVSGIIALLLLWQIRRILHNANTGNIFSQSTVHCMRIAGVEALVAAVFYGVMLFVGMTKFSVGLLALVFALFGLIALIFSDFFLQAIDYKKENDMTI